MTWQKLKRLWIILEDHRGTYGGAVFCLLLASVFLYLAPLIPQIVIDGALSSTPLADQPTYVQKAIQWGGGAAWIKAHLWAPALGVVILVVSAGFFSYVHGRGAAHASQKVIKRLRDRLYDHLQRLHSSYFSQVETGDLLQRCSSDVETLQLFLETQVTEIGRALFMFFLPLPILFWIDSRMAWASISLMPIIAVSSWIFFKKVGVFFKHKDEAEGKLTATVQENLTGIRVVRAFSRQEFECDKFEISNQSHRQKDYKLYVILAWFWSLSDILCMGQKALVVIYGASLIAKGQIEIGVYFYFITAVVMFIWPIRMMGRILAELGKCMIALDRIDEIFNEPTEPEGNESLKEALTGHVIFKDVKFTYPAGVNALKDISFEIKPGQTLALVGPSGSGKSTIVNLLLRFYDADQGEIQLDGHNISNLNPQEVRSQIAVVMQEPFLYSKTIQDNLKMASKKVSTQSIEESTTMACIHHSIQDFDQGYQTIVGERGVTLSGGQRQRLALSRALLRSPALLILDDSLSAVDLKTERQIIESLKKRKGQQSTILIAHRLSTLMQADEILVLDQGRIIQRGTHGELIKQKGLYARLWDNQTSKKAS